MPTEMHSAWRSHADFMEDIWALSEMEGVRRYEVEETPDTILEYRAQMAANNSGSIYDNPDQDEENVIYLMSGRGRGGVSTILRPGVSALSDSQVVEEVRQKLRQVSGLGYSNALIEQGVRAMTIATNKNKDSPGKPCREAPKLVTTNKTPSPRKTGNNTSGLCSPLEREASSSSSSPSNNSPCTPPPLSQMLKKAQEEKKQERQKVAEERTQGSKGKGRGNGSKGGSPVSPRNAWRDAAGSSSDEQSSPWRSPNGNSSKALFKKPPSNFNLNCDDFPALK